MSRDSSTPYWAAALIILIINVSLFAYGEKAAVIIVTPTTLVNLSTVTPKLTSTPTPTASATVGKSTAKLVTLTPTPTTASVLHVIKSGEMLLSIAAEYDTSVEAIMMVNEITDPTTLQIGQKLLIPVTPTSVAKTTPTPTAALVFHTIEAGDTLLALALQYDTTVDALMAANWLTDPSGLQIGQKLVIPPANGDLPNPIEWAPTAVHEVENGDTLLGIAAEYGSSLEDILAVNQDLEADTLQIGQVLKVPLTRQKVRFGSKAAPVNSVPVPVLSEADVAALKAGSPSLVGLEQQMIEAVNAQRQEAGLSAYVVDESLTLMAWSQAHDMVKRNYFWHITPDGRTLRDRFRERGLPAYQVGENIYLSVKSADQAVDAAINWFMGDAPHRHNILHQRFTRIGVGVAQQPTGWYNFVLVFAGD
ncbi:MAG: LysM peptidoglycan-binding domain-containing protein [Anaerolineae bacterium]